MALRGGNGPGFTLLEVMVAVAVLSFALASILGVAAHNVSLATRAADLRAAAGLADDMASEIDARGLSSVSAKSGKFEERPGFEWHVSVIPYNIPQLGTKMRIVSILITWDGGEESYEVSFVASDA